jgi:hypothetical protein
MATTIKLKNSVTTTNTPSSLAQGEVAINITDKKVWVGNAATTPIQLLGDGGSVTFTSLTVTGVSTFSAGTVSAPSITTSGDTNTGIFFPAADTIAFTEGGVESMRIDSSGNVGIGTSSPAEKLQVGSTSNRGNVKIISTDGNGISLQTGGGGAGSGTTISFYDADTSYAAQISSSKSAANTGDLLFSTANGSAAFGERMRITAGGNVLVGTTSGFNTAANRGNISVNGSTDSILSFGNGGSSSGYLYSYSTGLELTTVGSRNLVFQTNNTERMRIDTSGNVGIGTSSPVAKLQISSLSGADATYGGLFQIASSPTSLQQVSGFEFKTSTFGSGYGWKIDSIDSSGVHLVFGTRQNSATWSERMRIDSAGNVGLGTSSPQAREDIVFNNTGNSTPLIRLGAVSAASTVAATDGGFINYQNNNRLDISRGWHWTNGANFYSHATTGSCITLDESANILFANGTGLTAGGNSNLTERMRIDSSGNVGIGTSSPSFTAGSGLMIQNGTQANLKLDHFLNGGFEIQSVSSTLRFYSTAASAERMRITSGGDVLVGTTSNPDGIRLVVQSTVESHDFYRATATGGSASVGYWMSDVNGTKTAVAYIRTNGGLSNYSANNTNLSDQRIKTDIKLAGSYLDKICAIPVKTFKYKNVENAEDNLGVIAQEVEAVAPELISNDGFGDTPVDGVPLKSIYQTDLQYALMKAIQELNAKVEAQAAEIALLKSK